MSTHYETIQRAESFPEAFNVAAPAELGARDMWPRKPGLFIRAVAAEGEPPTETPTDTSQEAPQDTPQDTSKDTQVTRELVAAQWGLVPHWVKSASDGKLRATKLVNAVAETAANSKNFRDAWLQNQRCIVPMQAFWVDDMRSGKAVPTRISRIDGKPMAVAGLWASWAGPDGVPMLSYTLLTVNSNSHALMRRYKPAGNDGFMPVILNEGAVDAWLTARIEKAKEFMRQYPANWLAANPLETKADKIPKGLF